MELYGTYRASVVDSDDPTGRGRLQVDVPAASLVGVWAEASLPPVSAWLVSVPPAGSSIWVQFEGGDVDRPVWTGVTWGT